MRALRPGAPRPWCIPAVSSVALAFARLGLDWADALVLSAHGRDLRPVLAAALAHPKAAILTGPPEATAGQLRNALLAAGRTVYAAERLGTPGERVHNLTADPPPPSPTRTCSSVSIPPPLSPPPPEPAALVPSRPIRRRLIPSRPVPPPLDPARSIPPR